MTVEPIDKMKVMIAAKRATRDFATLLRSVRTPDRKAIGYWDTGDVAAHVSHIFGMYPAFARGEGSPVQDHLKLAEYWDQRLAEDRERDPAVIADRIEASMEEFSQTIEAVDWEQRVPWHGPLEVPVWCLPTVLISEPGIHGLDIATAEGKPWEISASDARFVIHGLMPLLEGFVDPQATRDVGATFALHVRGGRTFYVEIDHGSCRTSSRPTKVDCHISTAPVDYVLIGYGRRSQIPAALKGRVIAWGKKPWLSLRFPKYFNSV